MKKGVKTPKPKYPWKWQLDSISKGIFVCGQKYTVFSCFGGGGGSSMGYKLVGYNVIGFNEIDKKMANCYIKNLKPKYKYIESIRELVKRKNLPKQLYQLDILDGSPPCSSFSLAGNREKDWGKQKQFREGQQKQILDTLFFDFLELAEKLKPKIIVAENVKGLQIGIAKKRLQSIILQFHKIGYATTLHLLDSSKMGVPQKRERIFIFGIRKNLLSNIPCTGILKYEPKLDLNFNYKPIPFKVIADYKGEQQTKINRKAWEYRKYGDLNIINAKKRAGIKPTNFNLFFVYDEKPLPTLPAKGETCSILFSKPIKLSKTEYIYGSTFPIDYDFLNLKPSYVMGMSVPPVMMACIANEIKKQWLNKIWKGWYYGQFFIFKKPS